jgi:hypothetical protein
MAEPKTRNLLQEVIIRVADHLVWVRKMLGESEIRNAIFADLGVGPGAPLPDLPQDRLDSIERYRQAADPDKQALLTVLDDIFAVFDSILAMGDAIGSGSDETKREIGYRLLNLLLLNYTRQQYPVLYKVGQLGGFIEEAGQVHANEQIFFDRVPKLFGGIGVFFEQRFGKLDTEESAKIWSDNLFPLIAGILAFLGNKEAKKGKVSDFLATKNVIYSWDAAPGSSTPVANKLSERALSIAFEHVKKESSGTESEGSLNVTLLFVPRTDGGPGLFVSLGGAGEIEAPVSEDWRLKFKASAAGALDFLIGENPAASGSVGARASLAIEAATDAVQNYVVPSKKETRVEFGQLSFGGEISDEGAGFKLLVKDGALVISSGDCDSFTAEALPDRETRVAFNLGLGLSSERGFYLEGGTGLQAVIPIGKSVGPTNIQQLMIRLVPTTDSKPAKLTVELAASFSAKLGSVTVAVDQMGLQAKVPFARSGNKWDFSIGLKPPNGVGLAIDSLEATGGGFLFYDSERKQYAGVIHLTLEGGITVKAVGLISTELPGAAKGYSLLIIITAEDFQPIPLPLGFRLTGIGGLLAINRTFAEDVLRAGLKNHTLDSVLFPQDPIRNAPQILSNLNSVFPPANGHHLFGPAAQVVWGTPTLITADLAIVLEFGQRQRMLLLAQVVAILPRKEHELLRLQMDSVGVLDFDEGSAALDATLYDSRLLKKFVLTGDMAMRLKWEASPYFALAVGGLHPAFNPPPNFPKLERITINLTTGDNPRLRADAYFALTANTVQFGARAELYASKAGFNIHGEIGFDVLIQIDPFQFLADFRAQVQLKRGSRNLFKVRVEGALAGPRPLHLKAKATFEILWWDISIRVDKTLVEGELPPPPEPVDVLPRLIEALKNPASWTSQLPERQRSMVTLRSRATSANEVLLHPLGTLTVKQGVVPLNVEISRFGHTAVSGARIFAVSADQASESEPVRDFFAPAQFFEMTDDEKLTRPSFESLVAGVRIGSQLYAITENSDDWLEVGKLEFDTFILDKEKNISRPSRTDDPGQPRGPQRYSPHPEHLIRQARFGAAGMSELRRTGSAKYRTSRRGYEVQTTGWSIVDTDDLKAQLLPGIEPGRPASYSEAAEHLRRLRQENPAKAAGLKILRRSEVELPID